MAMESNAVRECQVRNCMLTSWYEKFARHTFRTTFVPLPESFIDYLQSDGIFVSTDTFPTPQRDEYDSSDEGWSEGEEAPAESVPSFPEVEAAIYAAVTKYGAVFPKLNWSSPRDATWMSPTGSLKCTTPGEIYLLLKSSDFIQHDLSHAFEECTERNSSRPEQFVLALREWRELSSSMEFRCFVRRNALIAVSQRDYSAFYPFLLRVRNELKQKIRTFFEEVVRGRFPDEDFVLDIYIDSPRDRVWLVDFNPFGRVTDPLLFTWDELSALAARGEPADFELRLVDTPTAVRPLVSDAHRLPRDFVDLSNGEAIAEFARRVRRGELDSDEPVLEGAPKATATR